MADAIIMALAALFGTCCFLGIWIMHVIQRDRLWGILAAEDEDEFLKRFGEGIIRKRCQKARIFRDNCPQNEGEYYSFFHHLFIPVVAVQQERTVRGGSSLIKISIIMDAFILISLTAILIFAGDTISLLERCLVIMGAGFLICGIPILFYLVSRFGAEDLRIFRMIDERFERFYGSPPPQYRVQVASLLEEMDRMISSRSRWFNTFYDRGERKKPRPWSQMVDEMFPQRGKNIGGDDPRYR